LSEATANGSDCFNNLYELLGGNVPWWAVLFASALAFRLVFLFPMIIAQKHMAMRISVHNTPEYQKLNAKIAQIITVDDEYRRLGYEIQKNDLYMAMYPNYKPTTIVIPYVFNAFVYMYLLLSVQHLMKVQPLLESGGILWFTNLSSSDPLYILPFMVWMVQSLVLEISIRYNPNTDGISPTMKTQKFYVRLIVHSVFTSVAVFIAAKLEAGLLMFWLASAFCSLLQNMFVYNSSFRQKFGFPPSVSTPQPPSAIGMQQQQQRSIPLADENEQTMNNRRDNESVYARNLPSFDTLQQQQHHRQLQPEDKSKVFTPEEWQRMMGTKSGTFQFKDPQLGPVISTDFQKATLTLSAKNALHGSDTPPSPER
jgi:membrane protein insertase Oxa1/YidC/SpoIIIJ